MSGDVHPLRELCARCPHARANHLIAEPGARPEVRDGCMVAGCSCRQFAEPDAHSVTGPPTLDELARTPNRFAVVRAPDVDAVACYLPDNYRVLGEHRGEVVIAGHDVAGWTLDGYVLPRLASGLRFGRELVGGAPWT